jgi:hypothetical protein
MKYPEGQKKSESEEVYIRRISKFPTLHPSTILRVVFQKANQNNLQHIKNWARPVFPKAFPPEDSNGIPFLNPENISTKAFAKWMAEEDIFEALRSLGEKPSPTAELFIELALGKTGNPTKHSAKTKANKGRWAEAKKHRAAVRKVAKKFWEEDDTRTIVYIIDDDEINIIKKSDGTNYSEGTLRNWIKDLAPSNKPGRRK